MLKTTETSKKVKVFGKNCKNLKFWNKLQKSHSFVNFFVTYDLIEKTIHVQSLKLSSNCIFNGIMLRQ